MTKDTPPREPLKRWVCKRGRMVPVAKDVDPDFPLGYVTDEAHRAALAERNAEIARADYATRRAVERAEQAERKLDEARERAAKWKNRALAQEDREVIEAYEQLDDLYPGAYTDEWDAARTDEGGKGE